MMKIKRTKTEHGTVVWFFYLGFGVTIITTRGLNELCKTPLFKSRYLTQFDVKPLGLGLVAAISKGF